jgi:hypothetical protein
MVRMNASTTRRAVGAAIVAGALVLIGAVAASGVLGDSSPVPTNPVPTATPVPTSTPTATPAPTVEPAPTPTPAPSGGIGDLDIRNLTDHDVKLHVTDATGKVVSLRSGTPGDGMSVRWFDVKVENVDATTVRVIWVGLPRDEVVQLGISAADGGYRLRFVQAAPPANSDAVGFDRIVEIAFDEPVRAADVRATIQESLDTQD